MSYDPEIRYLQYTAYRYMVQKQQMSAWLSEIGPDVAEFLIEPPIFPITLQQIYN